MNKICYLNLVTYSQKGGIESFNRTFLNVLSNNFKKVTSLSIYDDKVIQEFTNIDYKVFSGDKLKASFYLLKNIYKIKTLFVAHVNLMPIVILAMILNPRLIIYLNIYGVEVWKKLPLVYRLFMSNMKLLSISSYTSETFLNYNKINKKNVIYMGCNIYEKEVGSLNFDNPYDPKEFNILSVTRLTSSNNYKGIDIMLNSIPLLVKKIPYLKYTIVGNGDDKERLFALAKDLKINKYVEFKGYVESIDSYYIFSDIFCLLSSGEGFGLVYAEAMNYSIPCIACSVGGQTDVVLDNETGYLCDYGDIDGTVNRILDLYKYPEKKEQFGKNGYKHLIKMFTFEKFEQRLQRILKF